MQAWDSFYRRTIDAIDLPIHVVDSNLRFRFFNLGFASWCKQLGLETDPIGRYLFDVFPFLPSDVRKEYEHVFESGSEITTEESTVVSGRTILTETKKVPVAGEHGVEGVLTIVRDVTSEKTGDVADVPGAGVADHALEYYKALFENAHDGIMIFRPDDEVILEANSRACELYGFDFEEFIGMSLKDISHDVARGERYIKETLESRVNRGFETIHYRKDGSRMRLEVKASVVEYNGQTAILTVVADITERKNREERLRNSEMRYELATSAASVGVWDWNIETNDFYLDKNIKALLGYTNEEIPNDIETWSQYVHPEDKEAVMAAAQDHLEGRTPQYQYEHRMKHKDGTVRWFMVRGHAIRDSKGKAIRMVGTDTDITDHKRLEDERRKLELQVRQAQKLESLGVLAGGIAHDFNNLLMGILGNTELILDKIPAHSPVKERVRRIAKTAKRAAELTQQITAFAGKGSFVVEPLNLNDIVKEMSYLLETSSSKSATINYQFDDDLPSIEADPTQIRQVILNLITNASESLGDKPGMISITTDRIVCDQGMLSGLQGHDELSEGLYVTLEVSDSGSGIDKANMEKLFDPFFSTKFTGRGLGLASTLGIVRAHKGAIRVSSRPGQGSTFSVMFPASQRPITISTSEPEVRDGWQGSGTVLVVDDEEEVREVTQDMLEALGFKVMTAKDGQEGVELFHRHSQELSAVLLDMLMPIMDGATAFPLMLEADCSVPIILMSGYSEQEATGQFIGKDLAGFIKKPYDLRQLTAKMREVLESG
jgi:PAS domain S-box-containing protein